jgi:hypothetical protein
LLLLAKNINENELDRSCLNFAKRGNLKSLTCAIDKYYKKAFSPEIINILHFIENSQYAAELIAENASFSAEKGTNVSYTESCFQVNMMVILNHFKDAFSALKMRNNHILFIDGIDIRPGEIAYADYLECIKGLSNAVWNINTDFFANIKDSKGRFKVILLLRPDIYNSIGLQNLTNKILDNSVYLDWRTTYADYRASLLFELSDNILRVQQNEEYKKGDSWDAYFSWKTDSKNTENRDEDSSFVSFLRFSYSRPRDIVTMLRFLQNEAKRRNKDEQEDFSAELFDSDEFKNMFSEYLMGGIRDQLCFYYDADEYDIFLKFFSFLKGERHFSYEMYQKAFAEYSEYILKTSTTIPLFAESEETFLQFLYDANIISYIEEKNQKRYFRFCYRERSPSNISPKVQYGLEYEIHYGLKKALNF